jgi:hypothetical protein
MNFLEKKYKEQMKKNPEIKKSIDKIKNILEKTKLELKN